MNSKIQGHTRGSYFKQIYVCIKHIVMHNCIRNEYAINQNLYDRRPLYNFRIFIPFHLTVLDYLPHIFCDLCKTFILFHLICQTIEMSR